ncbi:hypothetical protein E4J66_12020 [Actinomyces viscosus]|uniref:Uncharacterized protein n=1 Tax=Actinomyces viscosus TaxID=1656 RepID=A0A3S4VJQ5_ACTVI|nr:hypothetical protein [Actinomyces viscosus]TFH51456.1 hypothetical protein E4J66_12020 [Actinomyces viscosus]VEI15785.1 Uncharacterised protein [Actinomyces viscosus]
MSRRILSVVVTVLGLVLIALAVCSATIWKPSSKVEATLASGPSQPYVVTAPGVLSSAESDVAVTAKSSDGKDVHLFVARAADVEAWLSPDADNALPYTEVTGINADSGTLTASDQTQYCPPPSATPAASATASAQPSASAQAGATPSASGASGSQCSERKASGVSASGSDLWLGEKTGGSSVTFNTAETADRALLPRKNVDEQTVVMAMTDGKAQAPSLTISWSRQVETPWYFYGGLVLGGLFVLAGAFLFFIDLQLRRADVERRTRSAERAARIANADSVSTEGIPQVDDPDRQLTRRELRDKERAEASGEAWTDPRTGRVYLDGIEAPSVPQAPEMPPAGGYGDGLSGGFTGGFDGAGGGYGQSYLGQEDQAVAGVARGSSVVPGLDEAATQQYRASRGLEGLQDGEALAIASDDADVAGTPGFPDFTGAPGGAEAPAHTSHVSHVAPGAEPAPEQPEVQDHTRFAPQEHQEEPHGSHVAVEPDERRTLEGDTDEIEGLTASAPPQDPSIQVPTGFAQPGAQPWPVTDQSRPEPVAGPEPQPVETEDAGESSSSAVFTDPSTTVSWPSYSGGVELPPTADPAAIQAADAEPLGEPDPTADPHHQEHA